MPLDTVDVREERRIVTALFVDIVGSTTITERLDPEDARDVLGGAIASVISQVDSLGGTVKDLAGDGVLALFGAPTAHEDDAERAVLCGLRITDSIADYADDVVERWELDDLSVRIGVETGRAVLGLQGGGSRVEYGATGDVLNTAARLQGVAERGEVLVGAATRGMVEDRFTWGRSHSYTLRGKSHPVDASVAVAYAPRRHSTAIHGGVRLVGREDEMRRIRAALDRAPTGQGSLVLLVGEAGVGKSRLIEEARQAFAGTRGGTWLEAGAASHAVSVPYQLYRNLMLGWLGIALNAGRDEVRAAVDRQAPNLPGDLQGPLRTLSSSFTGVGESATTAEAAQQRVLSAFRELVTSLTASGPVGLVLEDLHWSDPTSLALTERVVELTARAPVTLLLTSRPEPGARAAMERMAETAGDRLVRIDLKPLTREGERELLHELIGGTTLPRPFEERLLDTTDGNPFFVEEQVHALFAAGAVEGRDGSVRFVAAPNLLLEPTVERALVARIDRLAPDDRAALLAAAVLGPRFDATLVAALIRADPSRSLEQLEHAGLVVGAGTDPQGVSTFRFRHALVQEAASMSLLRRQRRLLHARAADALQTTHVGREDEIAAALGHHLAEAGEVDRAIGFLRIAARDAADCCANQEGATLAREALALLDNGVRASAEHRAEAIELTQIEGTSWRAVARYDEAASALRRLLLLLPADDLLARARVHTLLGQTLSDAHAYDEALVELDTAEEIISDQPDDDAAFQLWLDVMLARGSVYYWLAEHRRYSDLIERVEPIVEDRATRQQRLDFYGSVRAALWRRDRYVISDELLRLDRRLYLAERDTEDEEARAWASFQHGFTLMWHRDLDEAEPLLVQSLAAAERLGLTMLRSRALTYLMVTARLRGDVDATEELLATVLEAADDGDLPEYEAMAAAAAAWVAYHRGDEEAVHEQGSRALARWAGLPNRYPIDWMACFPLLGVSVVRGQTAEARRWAEMMLAEPQQALPPALHQPLRAGADAAATGQDGAAAAWFQEALRSAVALRYL